MAVTIGLGASMFTIWATFAGTSLPLEEGDRVVAIQPFDKAAQRVHLATPLQDFWRWRRDVEIGRAGQCDALDRPGGDHARGRRRFCATRPR